MHGKPFAGPSIVAKESIQSSPGQRRKGHTLWTCGLNDILKYWITKGPFKREIRNARSIFGVEEDRLGDMSSTLMDPAYVTTRRTSQSTTWQELSFDTSTGSCSVGIVPYRIRNRAVIPSTYHQVDADESPSFVTHSQWPRRHRERHNLITLPQ